ncbi:sulfite exporter TauE/SafE family protein [Helicobacter turcicus]|uniref:Sulfite exporter TauE/SafE family protein n=1 Tax=Helicobacter turcicus TaxID=2867412 RepID=A0ABS7JMZ7_9HELI|nr:sulfite exporter TauE/SafE family protein [Helicobacter turcicus]MBX7490761.1 sulfite exporter TauE/SafE family protein [Helicobacter turcicus]MBX7545630.1 sulfite exporter TauE/SafE family protein [Helicobacter turcicus]
MEHLDLIGLFMIALLGGFGHCIGMCGGIVLAYSGKLTDNTITQKRQLIAYHTLYSLGRITTYVLSGAIVGTLGSMFNINGTLRGALFVFAGVAMILAGLSLFGKITFLTRLEHSIQNSKWYQSRFQKALSLKTPFSLYLLGILNGLLPCGFVYAFLFSAAGFASIPKAMLIMLIFGIGTLPSLFLFGLLANTAFYKPKFRKILMNVAAIAIIIFGGLMVQIGVKFLQNPQMGNKAHMKIDATNASNSSTGIHGAKNMESKMHSH